MPIFFPGYICFLPHHPVCFRYHAPGVYVQSMYTNFVTGQSPDQMPAGDHDIRVSDIEKATIKQKPMLIISQLGGRQHTQRSPNKRFLRDKGQQQMVKLLEKINQQWLRCLAEYRRPTHHLAGPYVTDEPANVANGAADKVARRSAPRAAQYPGESDERKG